MTRDWNSGWGQQTGWQEPQWDDKDGGENGEWKGDESGENIQSKESNQEVSGEVEERYSWKNATDGQTYWDQTEWSTYKKQFAIDWNELRKTLPEFDKDFYIPHPNVENRSDSEVAEILSLNKIQIIPSDNVEGKKWDDSKWESSPARPIPKPVTNLIEASFPEYITEKLCQELGGPLVEPTAVQKLLWPVALSGRDCVAIAPTGTGKTLGYLLPAIVHITAQEPVKPTDLSPIGLVILPSRELAQQVMEQAVLYGSSITDLGFEALRPVCVYGGVKKSIQQDELASKVPDLIVATPGRLMDFLGDGTINLSRVTYLVIDEVDRLISMDGKLGLHENGFVEDMLYISSLVRPERQCIMCSATGQRDVMHLARDLCGNEPVFFQIAEAEKTDHLIVNPNIEQHFTSAGDSLHDRLGFLIDHVLPSTFTEELGRIEQKMMIFANSKTRVDKITEVLRAAGWPAVGFHSDKSQAEREWIFENFKTGVCNILVSTDVMGRGMDFEDVRAVVNFDLPDSIEAYVHRVGRTGRIGKKVKKGYALSFLSKRDWLILPGLEKLLTDSGLEVPENLQKRIEEFHSYQHKSRLEAICKNPDNHHCADCGARAPRWSSVRLGILICPQCAGIHRKLGTHLSFVQSVTIDKWKLEWVETVEKMGNRIANMYFEASIPEHIRKPAPSDTTNTGGDIMDKSQAAKLEKWIRNKYELKLFVREDMIDPRTLVAEGKDPRITEPYGFVASTSPARKKSPKKNKRVIESPPPVILTSEVISSPPPVPFSPITLPTSFDWRQNVFISAWARSNGVES